jgi:CHC2 zinc finger
MEVCCLTPVCQYVYHTRIGSNGAECTPMQDSLPTPAAGDVRKDKRVRNSNTGRNWRLVAPVRSPAALKFIRESVMALTRSGRKILKRLRQRYGTGKGVRIQYRWTRYPGHQYLICPFHEEATASFTVDLQNGAYYCFGCHACGDIYVLAKKHPHLLGRPKQSVPTTDPDEPVDPDELIPF